MPLPDERTPDSLRADQDYDSGDLDAIAELEASPGWALVKGRILEVLENERQGLERPAGKAATNNRRGRILATRTILDIPSILRQEIRAKL